MVGRINILASLRRRRATLGRLFCLLFALATVSAGAAPCFAMGVPSQAIADQDAHAHSSANHEHTQVVAHDHATSVDAGDRAHSPCPHCPLSTGRSESVSTSSHAYCSATDDLADSGKTSPSLPPFKHLLSVALIDVDPVRSQPRYGWSRRLPVDSAFPSVALNLRHCVFLI
jgi:hypothetical protein